MPISLILRVNQFLNLLFLLYLCLNEKNVIIVFVMNVKLIHSNEENKEEWVELIHLMIINYYSEV